MLKSDLSKRVAWTRFSVYPQEARLFIDENKFSLAAHRGCNVIVVERIIAIQVAKDSAAYSIHKYFQSIVGSSQSKGAVYIDRLIGDRLIGDRLIGDRLIGDRVIDVFVYDCFYRKRNSSGVMLV